jgi:hypothetical protein
MADIFEEYYDEHDLDKNSNFGHMTRKQAIIEADYMHKALVEILSYLQDDGEDLGKVRAIAYDGIYESRI